MSTTQTTDDHATAFSQALHGAVDQYCDGLITHEELVQRSGKPRVTLTAHPELSEGFTPDGIASIVVRCAAMLAKFGREAQGLWTITADGKLMTSDIVMGGDDVSMELGRDGDHGWIMPRITYPLPEGCIHGDTLPDHMRRLTVHNGRVMSMRTADAMVEAGN